jgi:hypothetical protein
VNILQKAVDALQELRQYHNLEVNLEAGELCQLATEQGLEVSLALDDKTACLRVVTVLDSEPDAAHQARLYAALLAANLLSNATMVGNMAIEPENGALIFQHAYDLEAPAPGGFAAFLAKFIEMAAGLRQACIAPERIPVFLSGNNSMQWI